MVSLIDKSDNSYKSATLLLSKGHYCNSIQCAYFSSLQYAKGVLLNKLAEEDLKALAQNRGSHDAIIRETTRLMERKDGGKFAENINQLKRLRVNAIYNTDDYSEQVASEALTKSELIIRILKTIKN